MAQPAKSVLWVDEAELLEPHPVFSGDNGITVLMATVAELGRRMVRREGPPAARTA